MVDGTVGVKQAAGADRQIDNDTDGSIYRQKVWDAGPLGAWDYHAGINGTVDVIGRLVSLTAVAAGAASLTINGGDSIPIPAGGAFTLDVRGALDDPVLVFAGTSSFFVEVIS